MFVAGSIHAFGVDGKDSVCGRVLGPAVQRCRSAQVLTRGVPLGLVTVSFWRRARFRKAGSTLQRVSYPEARWPVCMLESSVGLLTATISVATVVLSGGSESTSVLSVATLRSLLALAFTTYTVLFLLRFVIPWFPQIKEERIPWSLVFWATEGVLRSTRRLIPPQGGVDITPLVWLALTSLAQELLVGPQGIVTILAR